MEMTSYETLALFYETSNTLDRFFDFWLSATFAVVVAAHLGRDSINRSYAGIIVVLYLSFTLSVLARQVVFSNFMITLRENMNNLEGLPDINWAIPIIDGSLLITMALGTVSAVYFLWRCGTATGREVDLPDNDAQP